MDIVNNRFINIRNNFSFYVCDLFNIVWFGYDKLNKMKKTKNICVECGNKIKGFGFLHHFKNTIVKTTFYCSKCYSKLNKPQVKSMKEM